MEALLVVEYDRQTLIQVEESRSSEVETLYDEYLKLVNGLTDDTVRRVSLYVRNRLNPVWTCVGEVRIAFPHQWQKIRPVNRPSRYWTVCSSKEPQPRVGHSFPVTEPFATANEAWESFKSLVDGFGAGALNLLALNVPNYGRIRGDDTDDITFCHIENPLTLNHFKRVQAAPARDDIEDIE